MGKRLSKSELLAEIARERDRLDILLEPLSPRQMTRSGATNAGWSVKDILGHLVGWQQLNLNWYESGLRGEQPELPAPGFSWRDIRALNDRIYRRNQRRSLQNVLADYRTFHDRMLRMIEEVPDRDFNKVGRFSWTGPTWTLSDYIRANTASHYRWAARHLRRWVRNQSG